MDASMSISLFCNITESSVNIQLYSGVELIRPPICQWFFSWATTDCDFQVTVTWALIADINSLDQLYVLFLIIILLHVHGTVRAPTIRKNNDFLSNVEENADCIIFEYTMNFID